MEIKKHIQKVTAFGVSLLVIALIVFIIKDNDKNKFSIKEENNENIIPISADILELQNNVAIDRENKLRDLNTAPKSLEQQNTTVITKNTVAPAPVAPAKKADKKTKTS